MLDLDSDEIEVDFTFDHVSEMEYVLLILELDMQTFLNSYLKLYGDRDFRGRRFLKVLDKKDLFLFDLAIVSSDCYFDLVFEATLDALIGFICFFNVLEIKVISHIIAQSARRLEFSRQIQELEVLGLVV